MATTAPYISGMPGQGRGIDDPGNSIPVVINGANPANPIPVFLSGGTFDFGETSTSPRQAAVIGNSTGELAYGSGGVSAQTLRTVLVTEQITSLLSRFPAAFGPQAGATSFAVALSTEDRSVLDAMAVDLGQIEAELVDQGTTLDAIDAAVDLLHTDLVAEKTVLDAVAVDVGQIEAELVAQTPILTAIEADTTQIVTNTGDTVTELSTANATLASIDAAAAAIVTNTGDIEAELVTLNGKVKTGAQTAANSLAVTLPTDLPRPKAVEWSVTRAPIYRNYGTANVGAAYTVLLADTGAAQHRISIFDSSGTPMMIATGGVGAEVVQFIVPPGGGDFDVYLPANSALSIKTADGSTANAGILILNFFAN